MKEAIQGAEEVIRVRDYHERTKHQPGRYARSLGYLDWANQPVPYRRYEGAARLALRHPPFEGIGSVSYEAALAGEGISAQPMDTSSISALFYYSLALSAWKQAGTNRWALRVNPSSGNLHPTEGYLICGPLDELRGTPGVFHYSPFDHALELRAPVGEATWRERVPGRVGERCLIGLTSIYWREAWKYGERAFRYCQHDVGHAIACVVWAARLLGWQVRMRDDLCSEALALLLGIAGQTGPEAERPEVLLEICGTGSDDPRPPFKEIDLVALSQAIAGVEWFGTPNPLSRTHHPWPVIGEVDATTQRPEAPAVVRNRIAVEKRIESRVEQTSANESNPSLSLARVIRQRRSAVAMDEVTEMARSTLYRVMRRLTPRGNPVLFSVLPWPPEVSLVVFVHRVDGLEPGLYGLMRDASHELELRTVTGGLAFDWESPPGCPKELGLWRWRKDNLREAAEVVSCQQAIAADGVFSLGMLARFDEPLKVRGAWFYRRLFWECGLIGQMLYLEAEAVGLRGTGIGCFFDDLVHQILGIADGSWQSLYHFTVGGAVADERIQTLEAYAHLTEDAPT